MLEAKLLGLNTLSSGRICLVRQAPEHAAFIYACTQDTEFMDLYRLNQNRNESETQIAERLVKDQDVLPENLKRFEWVIERLGKNGADNTAIGLVAIADYQAKHNRAEFLIGIKEQASKKMGLVFEAGLLVFDFAFNQLKLNKLISFVYGYNDYSQKNTLKLGLLQEGCLRQHIWHKHHGYIDLYQNGLLVSEFRESKILAKLSKRLLKRDITLKPPKLIPLDLDYLQKAQRALDQFTQS